jgi:hypothetical protein
VPPEGGTEAMEAVMAREELTALAAEPAGAKAVE